MSDLHLQHVRAQIIPLLEALDREVVEPGLLTAAATIAQVRGALDCPEKMAWVLGTHRHAALQGKLARFAAMQQGWDRRMQNGVPIYHLGNGLEITVKRTPQGRAASVSSQPIPVDEFDLHGHEQASLLPEFGILDSALMHIVALDYVVRPDGERLTAMFQRRGAKEFIPLAHVISKSVIALPLPAVLEDTRVLKSKMAFPRKQRSG